MSQIDDETTLNAHWTLAFWSVLLGYFSLQVILRLVFGGAYELDEAEMSVMTERLQFGYGPQLPLYNWLQYILFELIGRSLLPLALLKNLLLGGMYAFVFLGLRQQFSARSATLAALSVFLIPYMAYEAQRATTHSTIMLICSAITLTVLLYAARKQSIFAFLLLGGAMVLGGVSKYNYWIVPISLALAAICLPDWHKVILRRRALWALLPLVLLVPPYLWMAKNPALASASVGKLALGHDPTARVQGITEMVLALISMLLLPGAFLLLARLISRRVIRLEPMPEASALLLLAGAISIGIVSISVIVANVANVSAHWMLPSSFLILCGLTTWLAPALTRRGVGIVVGIAFVLAVAVVAGLTYDRYSDGSRKDLDFADLPGQIEEIAGQDHPNVLAEFFLAGNVKRHRQDWKVMPPFGNVAEVFSGKKVVILLRDRAPGAFSRTLQRSGLDELAIDTLSSGAIDIPYAGSANVLTIDYVFVEVPE